MREKTKRYIKIAIIAIVVLSILGYAYSTTEALLHGATITVISPENGATVHHSPIVIKANVENAATITLNGRTVFSNGEGEIIEREMLNTGYNIIVLQAKNRFGQSTEKTIELVYK